MSAALLTRALRVSVPRFTRVRAASTTYFSKDHEYARVDGGVATIGITDFAQTQLGDVVYVSLPAVGDSFKKGWVRTSDGDRAIESARVSCRAVRKCNGGSFVDEPPVSGRPSHG